MLLGNVRSGSYFLQHLLNSHPNLEMHGELFNPILEPRRCKKPEESDESYLIRALSTQDKEISVTGFKLVYPQYAHAASLFDSLTKNASWRFIHLIRNNLLELYISRRLANITNQWILFSEQDRASFRSLHIDYNDMVNLFKHCESSDRDFAKRLPVNRTFTVIYEDLCEDLLTTSKNICNFLEVEIINLSSTTIRQGNASLESVIQNYQEIREKLQDTKWAHFLS